MEDLQDAIADARYMGERAEQCPEPLVPINWPSKEKLASFHSISLSENPSCFRYENIVSQPAGKYLFIKFGLSQNYPYVAERLQFLKEIAEFKEIVDATVRLSRARRIYQTFLGHPKERKGSQGSTGRVFPKYNMCRASSSVTNSDVDFPGSPKGYSPKRISKAVSLNRLDEYIDKVNLETEQLEEWHGNKVGTEWNVVKTIQNHINNEEDLMYQRGESYSNLTAGFRFSVPNPSLFDEVIKIFTTEMGKLETAFLDDKLFQVFLGVKCMELERVSPDNFTSFRIIGRGGFGEVYAQKRIETGKMYAVKALKKGLVKHKRAEDLCWNEMKALSCAYSPFIVNLKYAFQSRTELFLVLDLMSGGDLCYHLNKSPAGRFPASQSRFHAMEILLGIRHLHEQGYVYRDLKPDNVLLTDTGHCKISDLGLAVEKSHQLVGTAGTLGYMPPEMFRRNEAGHYDPHSGKKTPYNETADWWSFGCIVFEMLVGKCPFRTSAAKQYYERLFNKPCPGGTALSYRYATCTMEVEFNSSVFQSEEGELAKKLIRGCLNRNPKERFGANEVLFNKLKYNRWFVDYFDVEAVENREIDPPFVPKKDEINAESVKEIRKETSKKELAKLLPQDQRKWKDWYFLSRDAFQEEIVEYLKYEENNGPIEVPKDQEIKFCTIM